jgi:acyl carrier protein
MALSKEVLFDFVTNNLGIDASELEEDTPLFSSGLIDSKSMVDLIVYIEGEGGVSFEADDITLDHLDTIGRILRFVDSRHDQ